MARLGGDEFAVLQAPGEDQKAGAIALSERILAAVTEPYDLNGRKLILETSIGIALAPQDGDDADTLIKHADLALYQAQIRGPQPLLLLRPPPWTRRRATRRELEDDMREAISRNEFELHYQTIVDLESRAAVAALEALARWRHPATGRHSARSIHPSRRGERPDRSTWRSGSCGRLVPTRSKWPPRLQGGGQPVAGPIQARRSARALSTSTLADTGLPAGAAGA